MKFLRYTFFFLMLPFYGFAQSISFNDSSQDYKVYDSFLAYENSNLFNGLEYVDPFRSLNLKNHKFYGSSDFVIGSVVYNKQPYFNVKMKYDLLNDLVILEFVNIKVTLLSLNSSLINQFEVNNETFVRLPETQELSSIYGNGFFKEAYKGQDYTLYIKYSKSKIEKLRDKQVLYAFKNHEDYVLFYNNKYITIDSKKNLIAAIPEKEKEISTHYKSNGRLYKKDKYQFFIKLLKNLD